jgi:hypothetical protein
MIVLPLESPAFLPENPSLLFLASLLLLCPSCWRLCCCWFPAVLGCWRISAGVVGVPAVATSLLFPTSLLLLVPYCCWFPCCCWFPAVWCLSCCCFPDIYSSLLLLAGSLLFLAFLLLLVPYIYCCWLLCCCCFPAIIFPDFPLRVINNCFETNFASIFILHETKFRASFSKRNSEKFSFPRKRRNSDEKPVSLVYSVFRGIISWSENGNPKVHGAESRIKRTELIRLSTKFGNNAFNLRTRVKKMARSQSPEKRQEKEGAQEEKS